MPSDISAGRRSAGLTFRSCRPSCSSRLHLRPADLAGRHAQRRSRPAYPGALRLTLAIDTFVAVDEILAPSRGAQLRVRFFGLTTILIGAGVILFMLAVALLAPWLAPDDPFAQDLSQRLLPPVWHERGSWTH